MSDSLLHAFHMMGKRNDVIRDTHGNLSQRVDGGMYIKPSGMEYELIQAADLCFVEENGSYNTLRTPSVDTPHHLSIYQINPEVGAICHTHSPYATSFAMCGIPVQVACTEHADYFGQDIRCLKYSSLDVWGQEVVLKEGEKAVLLANHGVLTFGKTPLEAVKLAIALENITMKMTLAASCGANINFMKKKEVEKWHQRYQEIYGQR